MRGRDPGGRNSEPGNPRFPRSALLEGPMTLSDIEKQLGNYRLNPKSLFQCLDVATRSNAKRLTSLIKVLLIESCRQSMHKNGGGGFCEPFKKDHEDIGRVRMLLVKSWSEGKETSESHEEAVRMGTNIVEEGEPDALLRLLNVLTEDPMSHVETEQCIRLAQRCEDKLLAHYRKMIDR